MRNTSAAVIAAFCATAAASLTGCATNAAYSVSEPVPKAAELAPEPPAHPAPPVKYPNSSPTKTSAPESTPVPKSASTRQDAPSEPLGAVATKPKAPRRAQQLPVCKPLQRSFIDQSKTRVVDGEERMAQLSAFIESTRNRIAAARQPDHRAALRAQLAQSREAYAAAEDYVEIATKTIEDVTSTCRP